MENKNLRHSPGKNISWKQVCTFENIKEFFSEFQVIFYGLAVFGLSNLASHKINHVFEEIKYGVQNQLNQNIGTHFDISKQKEVEKIFQKISQDIGTQDLEDPDFQQALYSAIKSYEETTGIKLIQSLLLGFLYGFAYLKTIRRVRDEYMKIDVKSFLTFSLTSGGMVLVNGLVPGSIVYLESFLLAGYAVFLHLKNTIEGKDNGNDILNDTLFNSPIPTVRYDGSGKPILWNKKIEDETGYTHAEVLQYYQQHGEVMSLLYKGENLEKVKQYLLQIEKTGKGYSDVAFSMTTKSGEEKTFLWTTQPDLLIKGGTTRYAKHLVDEDEKQRELEETRQLLRKDSLTGALNKSALEHDLKELILSLEKSDFPRHDYAYVIIDIDNFKACNDKYGHVFGDKVLQELVRTITQHIRGDDRVYRMGGDEFVIIFQTSELEPIIKKLDKIRKEFLEKVFHIDGKIVSQIGTSWGVQKINFSTVGEKVHRETKEEVTKIKHETDTYLYAVKYLHLIADILQYRGISPESLPKKNAIGYPEFDEKGIFLGVKVLNNQGVIFISKEEFELLEERKQNMDSQLRD